MGKECCEKCRGKGEKCRGVSVCAFSRERGTVRWWDLFIVIPVLQLSSSLARPLINHSSTTHHVSQGLPSLSPALLALISRPQPGLYPLRAISRPPMAPTRSEEEEGRRRGERVYVCSRIRAILQRTKLMKTKETLRIDIYIS